MQPFSRPFACVCALATPCMRPRVSSFVEFHHSATDAQRAGLPRYGLEPQAFERLKERVHSAMEQDSCRLRLYWRSFWASCGDEQRFMWRDSAQASAVLSSS